MENNIEENTPKNENIFTLMLRGENVLQISNVNSDVLIKLKEIVTNTSTNEETSKEKYIKEILEEANKVLEKEEYNELKSKINVALTNKPNKVNKATNKKQKNKGLTQ